VVIYTQRLETTVTRCWRCQSERRTIWMLSYPVV